MHAVDISLVPTFSRERAPPPSMLEQHLQEISSAAHLLLAVSVSHLAHTLANSCHSDDQH